MARPRKMAEVVVEQHTHQLGMIVVNEHIKGKSNLLVAKITDDFGNLVPMGWAGVEVHIKEQGAIDTRLVGR